MIAYCLVTKPIQGRWKNQWSIFGTLTQQSLYMSRTDAEAKRAEAIKYLQSTGSQEVRPEDILIAEVKFDVPVHNVNIGTREL